MPSPTTWTRLEPRFRDRELRDSLTATLHDPLWLLGRQWQLGEFSGEDGGTPIHASLTLTQRPLTHYQLGADGPVSPYRVGDSTPSPPLETLVERERVRPPTGDDLDNSGSRNLRLAAEAGEQFRRFLAAEGISVTPESYGDADLSAFPGVESLLLAPESTSEDPASDRYLGVVRRRVLDGDALYRVISRAIPPDLESDAGGASGGTGGGSGGGGAPGTPALPQPDPAPADLDAYRGAAEQYRDWYAELYTEPEESSNDGDAWNDDRLEHEFAVAAGASDEQVVLGATEYRGGRLDWYSFEFRPGERLTQPIWSVFDPPFDYELEEIRRILDSMDDLPGFPDGGISSDTLPLGPWDTAAAGDGNEVAQPVGDGGSAEATDVPSTEPDAFPTELSLDRTPSPVRYDGMPAPRWWELEDSEVNLDDIDAGPEDLSRLLLLEFALLYGNDWFEVPIELSVGTLATVSDLTVTDTFGTETTVEHTADTVADSPSSEESAGTADGTEPDAGAWRLFDFDLGEERGLFMPPVLADVLETDPVEEVQFVRDEMVNVGWALEERIEGPIGGAIDRHELAQEAEARTDADAFELPVASIADVRYELATEVPDYWLPLLPVQDAAHQVTLHLGDLLDGSGERNEARGRLLSDDLAVPEEEIPRAGTAVRRTYQLARWHDGATYLWSGRRSDPGRGEGSSGLRFDVLADREGHSQGAGHAGSTGPPLAVVSIQSRPPGYGPDSLNEEYLVLLNVSGHALNVTDWTVADLADHSYTFDPTTLSPGEAVVLRTGTGTDTDHVKYWGSPNPIWNDRADAVRVSDRNGEGVLVQYYPDLSGVAPDSPIEIVDLHVDSSGDDYETLHDEYIVLENTLEPPAEGDGSVDLSGWVVRDIANHRYVFPEDSTSVLGPGEQLSLRTGRGHDEAGTRYWGSATPVWNNTDDAVLLFDSDGQLMAGRVY